MDARTIDVEESVEVANISDQQQDLLTRFSERERYPAEILARHLITFLREKPKDEPLDPQWLGIWDKSKGIVAHRVPPSFVDEIEEAIQSIRVVDEEIWNLSCYKNTKVTFLLGAGASAASGIPTVDGLLPELWKRARKIGRADLDKLARWCDEQGIINIEDLLTAAYISNFAATNRGITSLLSYFLFSRGREFAEREEFLVRRLPTRTSEVDVSSISFLQDTLQTLFALLTSTMISASPNPTHDAIVEFIGEHKNTSIITTNYDGCMDEAMLRDKIHLKGTIGSEGEENDPNAVKLVKMHGSINWAYCDSCQDVREFSLLDLKETYDKDKLSYPVMGICKNCGGLRRPLLVPPLSFKFLMFPNLIDIWNSANQSIEEAAYLIVVGYSFSEADTYITKVISRSMSVNETQKMIIVNTNPRIVPGQRDRFSAHIDGFNERRILNACESSEKALPDILKAMLGKGGAKGKAKQGSRRTSSSQT